MAHTTLNVLLSELNFIVLFLLISAYNSSWGAGPYPAWPRGWSAWTYRIVWGLLTNGLAVAVFCYFWASNKVDESDDGFFRIEHAWIYDWTWILIITHFVHVKLLGIYNRARYLETEYYISTLLYVLTIFAGTALSILCFYQKAWGAAIGFTAHTAGLLVVLLMFAYRLDAAGRAEAKKAYSLRANYRQFVGELRPENQKKK